MPKNPEEKEKCQEKLNQMQKFLPFLDFMIDKIKKKNEFSLECQLNKFQVLRSMIAEKNEKYTWDVLIKVENVIEKLISKLDYKGNEEQTRHCVEAKDVCCSKLKMSASGPRTSRSKNVADSKTKANNSSNAVDLIMKSLKMSVGVNNNSSSQNQLGRDKTQPPLGEKSKTEVSGKVLVTDLDKDLDGFELTDCSIGSEENSKTGSVSNSEKATPQEDLLTSSREKLLKSLQNRLFPNRGEHVSSHHISANTNKCSSGESSNQSSNHKSGFESNEHGVSGKLSTKTRTLEESNVPASKSTKTLTVLEKQRSDSNSSEINLKQKLKEKLSTDICEVYRVPGKSVGGSLRGLKDSRDHKKGSFSEEELFKPDVPTKINVPSRGSSSILKSPVEVKDKSRHESIISELKVEKSSDKLSKNVSVSDGSNKQNERHFKDSDNKNVKSNTSPDKKSSNKSDKKDASKISEKDEKSIKDFQMSELNDDELTEFVKENIQHLPHLAKLKPSELRKTLESSYVDAIIHSDVETVSDDSLQEFDEFLTSRSKSPNELRSTALSSNSKSKQRERHPLASLKIAEITSDSLSENKKSVSSLTKGLRVSERVEDKTHDTELISSAESLDEEEDYAIQLIEETTPKNVPVKKKKGLLELPMPEVGDLFDEITSIESFESVCSPSECRDPRLKKKAAQQENDKKAIKTDSTSQSKQLLHCESKPQEGVQQASVFVGNSHLANERNNECRLDEKPVTSSHLFEDSNSYKKCSKELKNSHSKVLTNLYIHKNSKLGEPNVSAPKSYAEYKRMKRKEREKLKQGEGGLQEVVQKFSDCNIPESSHFPIEKNTSNSNLNKTSDLRLPIHGNTKRSWSRSRNRRRSRHRRKAELQRPSGIEIFRTGEDSLEEKKHDEGDRQKISDEKRRVAEPEELVSPLEKLYQTESKPKTGRGYGIQHFKIPKKVPNPPSKSNGNPPSLKEKNEVTRNDPQTQLSGTQNESSSLKLKVNKETLMSEQQEETKATSTTTEVKKKTVDENQRNLEEINESPDNENEASINGLGKAEVILKTNKDKCDSQVVPDAKTNDQPRSEINSRSDFCAEPVSICGRIENVKGYVEKQKETKAEQNLIAEPVKKYEPEIVECDSSVENSTLIDPVSTKNSTPSENSTIMSKEEITQEFVEALIKKSFESGQGKLLLAQAKLFEELGKKLNSKKLKTIQKIINSESESTSSSSESSSSSGKKKKKSKKSKKLKRKGKKNKKHVISSTSDTSFSSSSSESEENAEEKSNVKRKKSDSCEMQDKISENIPLEEMEPKKIDFTTKAKSKKKKKRLDYPGCFSRKRNKRKQQQKKLIEKILNEEEIKRGETLSKEAEQKLKPKPKAKIKTELDKLHEDIKNMFISSGVVTATGQRMCRILRNSGGKMDNVDIVKESAKMVEEEKLKRAQTHSRPPRLSSSNSYGESNGSRSQSSDKSLDRLSFENRQENEYDQDPKLKAKAYILLQKVDLNNFGYGVKISDDCISFCRKQGRNTAIRGLKSFGKSSTNELHPGSPARDPYKGIFLARNKRKYQRLNGKNCKTSYAGKKLMDVVKNLPLKMAKMKHLQFCEKKSDDTRKKKVVPEKLDKKMARLGETKKFSDDDLMNHAFQLRKTTYRCKVCSRNFRNITEHYKTMHPEHGVLISRLCQKEANRAKSDAIKNNYEGDQNALKESCKRNTRAVSKNPSSYHCRMCSSARTNDVNVFFTHVTSHTGEVRFQCPMEDCGIQTANGESIKFHILTKHTKRRYELYNKIIELYPSPIEGCQLFGFLCSKCNFVQLSRSNMQDHVSKQHASEDVKILKINMSSDTSNRSKIKRMVIKNGAKNAEQFLRRKKKDEEPAEVEKVDLDKDDTRGDVGEEVSQEQKSGTNGEDVISSTSKSFPQKLEKPVLESEESVRITKITEEDPVIEEKLVKNRLDNRENSGEDLLGNNDRIIESLEVGPLKCIMLENSEVYYKCRVQNCGLFTKGFEKFEQHLTYNHYKKKWDGLCKICSLKVSTDLISALKHLKFHLVRSKPIGSTNDSKMNKAELPSQVVLISEESVLLKEGVSDCKKDKTVETAEAPYPTKPLLKVRNLVGDRLSTPRECADESEVIILTEDEETNQASQEDTMFTIENVRSLKTEIEPEASDCEQVCIVNDQNHAGAQMAPGKVILVRSCPTRKIAIRPENNPVSFDVGHFNVVQTSVPAHPMMLSPVSTGAPIQLLSPLQTVSQNSRIPIKPVIVSSSVTFKGSSNSVPIIRTATASATVLPVSPKSEICETLLKSTSGETPDVNRLLKSKHPVEITVSVSPSEHKSPCTTARAKGFSEALNSEEQEEKELINPLRIFTSQNTGSKTVKDAEIYKQMLTKTKLCHLFKCMAVECSFTCNSENVFTRHIGLHEAQRRLKNKGLKGNISPLNKSNKAFQWQQCAYCCQILNHSESSLSRHVLLEHGHCLYQCAYCFYRAISHNYVEIHQNLVHSQILKTSSRIIYKCKPIANLATRSTALEKRGKKQSVRPYICDQCGLNFYVIQEFLCHLTTEHQAVTAYTCHICKNLCFKANRLINHYKLHSYCTYQCAYCLHGTETEVEMVFHLCNFHFSQPAIMYLRALPEGVESKGISQLESLKVVVYENDSLNEDHITEADLESEEDSTYDPLRESLDLSEIVAELGINSDAQLECEVTPLLKELASLSDQNTKDVTVKTLLPNAQFSSENDNVNEGCSVLISSGVSVASTQNDDREMSIPLGQLPLEALNIKHVQHSASSKNVEHPEKSSSSNENQTKETFPLRNDNGDGEDDEGEGGGGGKEEKEKEKGKKEEEKEKEENEKKQTELSPRPYVHNLPQVLLTRTLGPKNVYPSRRLTVAKKNTTDLNQAEAKGFQGSASSSQDVLKSCKNDSSETSTNKSAPLSNASNTEPELLKTEAQEKEPIVVESTQPLITSVVSLSNSGFVDETDKRASSPEEDSVSISRIVINVRSDVDVSIASNSRRKKAEDLEVDDSSQSLDESSELVIDETLGKKESDGDVNFPPKSPDVVILEEEKPNKTIETVTLDSDDEKDVENSKSEVEENEKNVAGGVEIRKEMEILRNQMVSETDSLLLDVPEGKTPLPDLNIALARNDSYENVQSTDVLSPIEEAICSLNKRLKSETNGAREKKVESESKPVESNPDEEECRKPRTRFGSREKKKECTEEKNSGSEESKKEESSKNKFTRELVGKNLYICGNEQCSFAADTNSSLKDHLYVCDFSRVSSALMCPHCSKHFKHFSPYLEHLKYHGEKKFHCGLCSFSSAVESATTRHMKQKHKCHVTKTVPKEPPNEEHIVFYPKNHKIDKVDFAENGYSPGDENKLPLQSIYQVNVKCAKCPYFTKVRSNMVRHLKIHIKSAETEGVIVPSTAPTNPVPCLESKEKMFDKMTNLAASSQMAQTEKEKFTPLPPQMEAKFPQFVPEHLRFKCCLLDCNYITVDDRMLKHHIKALHNEVTHYNCPHCQSTVHVGVRNPPLDKIGHHLKFHDSKLYKCGHCIYIHYQKNLVEKHSYEKHSDRRCFVQTVRESGTGTEEEHSGSEGDASVWKCARCDEFQSPSKSKLKDHLLNDHKTKASHQCQRCPMTGSGFKMFANHFASKHPGEEVAFTPLFYEQKIPSSKIGSLSGNSSGADSSNEHFDTTPLWQRGAPRIRHIRGILIEEEEVKTKKSKRSSVEDPEEENAIEPVSPRNKVFYCPLCSDKKKVFFTKNEDYFRTHLYQELNYQQFACILCGKMFVDKKDFDKHHARMHPDKPPEMNQTKEDGEIIFWVDKVIAKQREQMKEKKRKLSESESDESASAAKKRKET